MGEVNQQCSRFKLSALHVAARSNNLEGARLLVEARSNVRQKTSFGQTAADLAASSGASSSVIASVLQVPDATCTSVRQAPKLPWKSDAIQGSGFGVQHPALATFIVEDDSEVADASRHTDSRHTSQGPRHGPQGPQPTHNGNSAKQELYEDLVHEDSIEILGPRVCSKVSHQSVDASRAKVLDDGDVRRVEDAPERAHRR